MRAKDFQRMLAQMDEMVRVERRARVRRLFKSARAIRVGRTVRGRR